MNTSSPTDAPQAAGNPVVSTTNPSINDVVNLLNQQMNSINEIKASIKGQSNSLDDVTDSFADQKGQIDSLSSRLGNIEKATAAANIKNSTAEVKAEKVLSSAENALSSVDRLRQQLLKNSIEISGVPMLKDECTTDIAISIFSVLGLSLSSNNINSCYRLSQQTRINASGVPSPPVIVIELLREGTKQSILLAAKALKRTLSIEDVSLPNSPKSMIFINERLIPKIRRIFLDARRRKKNGLFKYVWTKNGRVHVRVGDGTPLLTFDSLEDIIAASGQQIPQPQPLISSQTAPQAEPLQMTPQTGNLGIKSNSSKSRNKRNKRKNKDRSDDQADCPLPPKHPRTAPESRYLLLIPPCSPIPLFWLMTLRLRIPLHLMEKPNLMR